MKHPASLLAGLSMAFVCATTRAADYRVQPGSTLSFSDTFQGVVFSGHFQKWNAAIRYDPANLDMSRFDVTVDTASAQAGDVDRDSALPGADFFNTAHYPQAYFVTTGFRKSGAQVLADGELTLRGVTHPLTLTVNFVPTSKGAMLEVNGSLKRLDFGVGSGEYADTSVIGADVKITARLLLTSP